MIQDTVSSKLSISKKDGPIFIADIPQLEQQLKTTSKRKLILGGQLLMVSLEALRVQQGFVSQPPRAIKRGLLSTSGDSKKLQLLLDKDALDRLGPSKRKPAFAIDALLKYGLKLKGSEEHCIIGALEASTSTQMVVLTFKKHELVSYNEYQLAHPSQNTYEADMHSWLEQRIQSNPAAIIHWCGPLNPPKLHNVKTPDSSLWNFAAVQTLTISGKPSALRQHGLAAMLVMAGVLGYFAAVYPAYLAYEASKKELLEESASLKGETSFNSERLSVLRSRQAFFEKQKRTEQRFDKFVDILAAFAQQPRLSVRKATLFSSKDDTGAARGGKPTEFEITVETPVLPGELTTLDQGKILLQSLSVKTGGNLRLATGGDSYSEVKNAKSGDYRTYRIQGDFKNAN
jgi:hypothetical protein